MTRAVINVFTADFLDKALSKLLQICRMFRENNEVTVKAFLEEDTNNDFDDENLQRLDAFTDIVSSLTFLLPHIVNLG